jgi:hypothetical protein
MVHPDNDENKISEERSSRWIARVEPGAAEP